MAAQVDSSACSPLLDAPLSAPPATKLVACGLVLGSSDPHCLALVERPEPPEGRRGAFSLLTHAGADDAELAVRDFPVANMPPVTSAPPTPSPPPAGAPTDLTDIGMVVPAATLRRVRWWRRALRRSLRAAARGDLSLARRLRPTDLWLPEAEHTMPAARGRAWDLLPFEQGLPAVELGSADADRAGLSSGLIPEAVTAAGIGFADQAIVAEMLQGLSDDARLPLGTLLCAPHASALAAFAVADAKLSASVAQGWATQHTDLPTWPIWVSPYGVVDESGRADKPKWRLTNDFSWPHPGTLPDGSGGFVPSINGSMDRSAWPEGKLVLALEVAEAAAIFQASGAPVKVWSLDATAYYRTVGRLRREVWRNAVARAETLDLDHRCCFGSAADAVKCSRISNLIAKVVREAIERFDEGHPPTDARVLAWQAVRAEEQSSLSFSAWYIDDGLGASFDDDVSDASGAPIFVGGLRLRRADAHFDCAVAALESLGFTSALLKEQRPAGSITSLGVDLSLVTRTVKLTDSKRKKYAKRIREMLAEASTSHEELLALLGRLGFASCFYPRGRQWLHAAWRAMRVRFRTASARVILSRKAREGLLQWARELESLEHAGVPLGRVARLPAPSSGEAAVIYADASSTFGWAAWTVSDETLLMTCGEWSQEQKDRLTIAELELLASTYGLVALAPLVGRRAVYSFTDNTVAQANMRQLTPSSEAAQHLCAARCEWLLQHGHEEVAARISSESNLWADLGSRAVVDEAERQAAGLGLAVRRVEVAADWLALVQSLAGVGGRAV